MIVYSGKQFWNNFNNGDDAVFGDSNRPRDENGFKLRPWLQGDKWDFRGVNKKTDFSMIAINGAWSVEYTPSWQGIRRRSITYRPKWTVQQMASAWFPWFDETTIKGTTMEIVNNPQYKITEQNVTYQSWDWLKTQDTYVLEIIESWLYYILTSWQFYMPDWYNTSTSYQNKFWVSLFQHYEDGIYRVFDQTQNRWCGNADGRHLTTTQFFPSWAKFIPLFAHTYSGWASVFSQFKAIKLW